MIDWIEALTIGEVLAALVAVGAITGGIKWLGPVLTAIHDFLSDWVGEPERDGVPMRPGVMLRLEQLDGLREDVDSIRGDLEQIKADAGSAAFHSRANHGQSSHDAVMRELTQLKDLFDERYQGSAFDRAEIRAHIGLPPLDPEDPKLGGTE